MVLLPEENGLSFQQQNGARLQRLDHRAAINIMAHLYTLNSLLEHLLREGASELHLSSERPPQIIIKSEEVAVGPGSITNDNIAELLYNMATVDQMKEPNACGDARFIYLFRNWARFGVTASVAQNNTFSIKIRNLGR